MQQTENDSLFGPVIFAYTRKQAIEDGVLVDLTQPETVALVAEAGFRLPLAMTATAFVATLAPIGTELPPGQDLKGRLWDVLNLLRWAIRRGRDTDRVHFTVAVWNGKRHDNVNLWALIGPGDDGEPVITIMMEGED